jgi:hypothetical protein
MRLSLGVVPLKKQEEILRTQGTKRTRPAYLNQHGTEFAGSCKWLFEEASSR